jgi:hypothetical protein
MRQRQTCSEPHAFFSSYAPFREMLIQIMRVGFRLLRMHIGAFYECALEHDVSEVPAIGRQQFDAI